MTAEFGSASQLEKIDMLDYADAVAINKFERRGSDDARRDVARQLVRNRAAFGADLGGHAGVRHERGQLQRRRRDRAVPVSCATRSRATACRSTDGQLAPVTTKASTALWAPVPARRVRYLAEIADTVRGYHDATGRRGRAGPAAAGAAAQRRADRRRAGARQLLLDAAATTEQAMDPVSVAALRRVAGPSRGLQRRRAGRHRRRRRAARRCAARRCRATRSRGSRCRATPTTANCSASCVARTCPATSRSRPACSRSSATTRTRPGCSPARATRSAPIAASTCCPRGSRRRGSRPRSTRSRCTAAIRAPVPTSTARSGRPGSRSRRSTT